MDLKYLLTFALAASLGLPVAAQSLPSDTAPTRLPGCSPMSADNVHRRMIESDVTAFVTAVPAASAARFEVQDCLMDGQIHNGKTIVLSARLARLSQPQRFFIIAHEFGHHQLEHQSQMSGLLARGSDRGVDRDGVTELAHRNEFEADAYAVRMMVAQGLDPDDAARLFDGLGEGRDNATHPAFHRRAKAIRAAAQAAAAAPAETIRPR